MAILAVASTWQYQAQVQSRTQWIFQTFTPRLCAIMTILSLKYLKWKLRGLVNLTIVAVCIKSHSGCVFTGSRACERWCRQPDQHLLSEKMLMGIESYIMSFGGAVYEKCKCSEAAENALQVPNCSISRLMSDKAVFCTCPTLYKVI